MRTHKGQVGFQAVTITVVIVAILLLVGVTILSSVGRTGSALFDKTAGTILNETVNAVSSDFTQFANTLDCVEIFDVTNASNNVVMNASSYVISGCSINVSCDIGDPTQCGVTTGQVLPVKVSYTYNNWTDTDARDSYSNTQTTTLDAMDLVVIGLIVLAAVAILAVLFMLGKG